MLSVDEAQRLVREHTAAMRIVSLPLANAVGHTFAEALYARESIPRFDNAAMDGYALRAEDCANAREQSPLHLRVVARQQAGGASKRRIGSGECARIFTGAAMPDGTDTVLMQERVERDGDCIIVTKPPRAGEHVRRRGEEFANGAVALREGSCATPAAIGMCATLGYARVRVYARPRVTLLVTGNELRTPGAILAPGQIPDANSYSIRAALTLMGYNCSVLRVRDDARRMLETVRGVLKSSDVLITSGGVSVGEHDVVREVMQQVGVCEHFWRVAMKPGKPVFFGTRGQRMVFGLPGNPLSALLGLYLFVRPALRQCMALPVDTRRVNATLASPLRNDSDREHFVFVELRDSANSLPQAFPLSSQGSHMLGAVAHAAAFLRLPASAGNWEAGRKVEVEYMRWDM